MSVRVQVGWNILDTVAAIIVLTNATLFASKLYSRGLFPKGLFT